jgi:ABC-type phosphate transport system substrate-binding protein
MTRFVLAGAILVWMFPGAARAQCTPGGLAVVVNKANPVESLSMAQLRKLLLGDVRAWQDHKQVALIARDSSTKAFQCLLSSVVRLSVGEYHRYIMNAEFRGDDPITIKIADSDQTASKYVMASPGSLAVVEANSVPSIAASVKVIHIDGKALGEPGYPL